MSKTTLLLLAATALAAFAGCSDAPPSGELVPAAHAQPLGGSTVSAEYIVRVDPYNQTGQDVCSLLPATPPVQQLQCTEPSSNYTITFVAPAPDAAGYRAWLVGAPDVTPRDIGALTAGGAANPMDGTQTFSLNASYAEELASTYTMVEVRMDGFVYATASTAPGINDFAPAEGVEGVTATGSYEGEELTVNVQGLPANATYVGWLYALDEAGVPQPTEKFSGLVAGENVLAAPQDIEDYAEFHIHVGESKINLWKGTIGEQA